MKVTRRSWIGMTLSLATTPTWLSAKPRSGYSLGEVEKRLHSGKGIEGMTKDDLPTPSLLVDLDLLESNIAKMSQHAKGFSQYPVLVGRKVDDTVGNDNIHTSIR